MNKNSQSIEQLDAKFKLMDEQNLAEHLVHLWNNTDMNGEWSGGKDVDNCLQKLRAGDRRLLIYDLTNIIYSAAVYTSEQRRCAVEIVDRLLGNWLPSYMRKLR